MCRLYPDSKMMGGRRTRKKAVGENTSSRFQFAMFPSDKTLINIPMRAPRTTTTMDSGRYWNPVCNIKWMRRIPQAITHRTKKMLMELLCSRSTAPLSGRSALFSVVLETGEEVVVVVDVVELVTDFSGSFSFSGGMSPVGVGGSFEVGADAGMALMVVVVDVVLLSTAGNVELGVPDSVDDLMGTSPSALKFVLGVVILISAIAWTPLGGPLSR